MDEDKRHVNDLWEDMDRLNALYEELMWDTDDVLEFSADYDNDQIIVPPHVDLSYSDWDNLELNKKCVKAFKKLFKNC